MQENTVILSIVSRNAAEFTQRKTISIDQKSARQDIGRLIVSGLCCSCGVLNAQPEKRLQRAPQACSDMKYLN